MENNWPRFFIESEKRTGILSLIDEEEYMNLDKRTDLMIYAMALGLNNPKDLKHRDSLIRTDEGCDINLHTLMVVAKLNSIDLDNEELDDFDHISISEHAFKCANTGLEIIEDKINNDPIENDLNVLQELQDLYDQYFPEN